jgi:hypothetical protein
MFSVIDKLGRDALEFPMSQKQSSRYWIFNTGDRFKGIIVSMSGSDGHADPKEGIKWCLSMKKENESPI